MSNINFNYKAQLFPITTAKSGSANNRSNNENNKDNYCGQTFQEILKQKLKDNVQPLPDATPKTFQAFFHKRPAY